MYCPFPLAAIAIALKFSSNLFALQEHQPLARSLAQTDWSLRLPQQMQNYLFHYHKLL